MNENECVFIGDFIRLDNKSNFSLTIHIFMNSNIPVFVCNKMKANKFYLLNREKFIN